MKTRLQIQHQIINCTFQAIFNRWINSYLCLTRGHGLPLLYDHDDWHIRKHARMVGGPLNRRNHWCQQLTAMNRREAQMVNAAPKMLEVLQWSRRAGEMSS
jgi:hypothetical protein